jgi:hypothetical protein
LCHATDDDLLSCLEWFINAAALDDLASRFLLPRAGAVARGGRGFIFPARSGSGKSTLTAALVAAGFHYLSDEVVAIEPESLLAIPFPRSPTIKRGSRSALAPWYPCLETDPVRARFVDSVTYPTPPEDSWPAHPFPVSCVVFPRYDANARPELRPIPRSEALPRLLDQCFEARSSGDHLVRAVVCVLQGADCYSLTVSDPRGAVRFVGDLADSQTGPHS